MLGKQEMKIKISRGFSCSPSHCIRIEIVVQSSHSGALWDTARRPMPSICGHTSPNPICLPIWVNKLDMEIERILGVRLQAGLRAWTQVLEQADDKTEVDMDTDVPQVSHKPGGEPKIKAKEQEVGDSELRGSKTSVEALRRQSSRGLNSLRPASCP
ncbi:uncharacterized protein LOC115649779 isoform X2 [Gopherus evgoodei]|uniref:uncharacterized protein LOC115649779 isoform X2 n=1 Tax=Gopherus evgoodei TaxID=1825980 RepID=UPI0011CFE83E|nr:uncharacterized protein LOC115649779 isoform X2 [Gopherus evgoodei]